MKPILLIALLCAGCEAKVKLEVKAEPALAITNSANGHILTNGLPPNPNKITCVDIDWAKIHMTKAEATNLGFTEFEYTNQPTLRVLDNEAEQAFELHYGDWNPTNVYIVTKWTPAVTTNDGEYKITFSENQ